MLRAQRVNGDVRVEVADDGPGFAAEDLAHVFEPLFRADRARATRRAAPGSASRSRGGSRAPTAATSRPPTTRAAVRARRWSCPRP